MTKLQATIKNRLFELQQRSSSQKISPSSGESISGKYEGARAVVRALRAKTATSRKSYFQQFFEMDWVGARFPRAHPRARTHSAGQSILLTKEILFDYQIITISLKLAKICSIEVLQILPQKCILRQNGVKQWNQGFNITQYQFFTTHLQEDC